MRRSSEETKREILAAARERFATDGYDRATIRAIAADASIDPSMVMRYFGSKEGLFAAAAEFDLDMPDLGRVPREDAGTTLAGHFFRRWEDDNESLRILLRTAVTEESVAERMRAIFAEQLVPTIAALTGDTESARGRAGLVATQMLGVALCRYVLRMPPVAAMDRQEIVGWLGPTLQRYLAGEK
ncbi:AcrR family transcriptional regulator [Lipingzhangella halophila]|uniref:AcrR family transcriptional regulator n=1 Tax=Lipingzhangella halophila TaxID=1783352 RepID=A0A7W7W271_9ACTN|nr:TetR family transcriptional regulator [Lipingzhangella halophila]MBB4930464.1 AcrR family transcriptional regulator [Lipingzhangella halophila]